MTTTATRSPDEPMQPPAAHPGSTAARLIDQHLLTRRITVALSLAVIGAIHILDLPGKFAETPYLAFAYIGIIIAVAVLIERVLVVGSRIDFLGAAALSAAVIVGFVINRTVGMPMAMGDIGNWLEPLGLLSLVVEFFAIWQALVAALVYHRRAR
ncbi:hypothetical protein E3O45_07590 [Cryobacterium sp. TMS1-20-1]|uniref:hypothetical protein n=1 Tax=unclassified Cryobacterium TaxID=2649013 RepID=UPI00106AAA85|nr:MULTISPECIES: hypothetical protein [unclassified Cryobacterium]TFC77217.1 hypothetical protein E3O45_07590 [Cryobacterium sp. TMS1-20-1]